MDLFPGRASIIIHEPIDPARYGKEEMDELIDLAKNQIQKGLDEFSA